MKQYVDNWTRGVQRECFDFGSREMSPIFIKPVTFLFRQAEAKDFLTALPKQCCEASDSIKQHSGLDWAGNVAGVVFFRELQRNLIMQAMGKVLE